MKKLVTYLSGFAFCYFGFSFMGQNQSGVGLIFLVLGMIVFLSGGKSKRRSVTSSYVPAQRYYSAMTNRTYASEAEKRHAEDIWAANAHYNPRF